MLFAYGLLAGACGAIDSEAGDAAGLEFVVMTINVGNLDEVNGGPCPSFPYRGGLCSLSQELILTEAIGRIGPDIAILNEVVDARRCTEETWGGDEDRVCTGAPGGSPFQQARRLMGDDYTISCDDIEHFTCVAVRVGRVEVQECEQGGTCLGASETPPHPSECEVLGGHTSVSRVRASFEGRTLNIVAVHPDNALSSEDDPCRFAQYRQVFEDLVDERPALVAGDFNLDPYRYPDLFPSGVFWREHVGFERRFAAHNAAGDRPVPTFLGVATLDYVLSDFAEGECQVLGESEGTQRIDSPLNTMDHRAVVCSLVWPTTP